MLNDVLNILDKESIFEHLGRERTQNLALKILDLSFDHDCNPGEILEGIGDRVGVCIFAIQIGEPCLDAPSGYENRDLVFPLRGLDIGVPAFFIKRRYAGIHATGIAINHDDEHTLDVIASAPVRLQFLRKAPAHESFRRPLARWGPLDAKLSFVPAHPPEKPPREHFVLLIFEQQDELDSPAHRSHPRATISDKRSMRLHAAKIKSGIRRGARYAFPREKSVQHFKDQIRKRTRRKAPVSTQKLINGINPVIRGWGQYYCKAHIRRLFHQLDSWVVRRTWSHRHKRWRNTGWKRLPERRLIGDYGLVRLISLVPSRKAGGPGRSATLLRALSHTLPAAAAVARARRCARGYRRGILDGASRALAGKRAGGPLRLREAVPDAEGSPCTGFASDTNTSRSPMMRTVTVVLFTGRRP